MKKPVVLILFFILISLLFINEYLLPVNKKEVSVSNIRSSGKALIGGEFSLLDQNGNQFGSENLKGKVSLVFFGFTHCPMVCPTALSNISLALDALGDEASNYNAVFITTDPERDTQQRLKEFLANFSGNIIGLTGTSEQIKVAQDAYKVFAQKLEADASGNYDMNHSSIIYIMDKNGEYINHMAHTTDVNIIVEKLRAANAS